MYQLCRSLLAATVAVSILAVPAAYGRARDKRLRHFRIVHDRVLYRSGQLSRGGLRRVSHDYGIRTVVSFRSAHEAGGTPPDQWEERFCARNGIRFVRIPAENWAEDGHGAVPAQDRVDEFLAVMRDPANHPVLAHCFRGVHRTGAFCAVYRMDCQGWPNADAIAEMKSCGYDILDQHADVRGYLEHYAPAGKCAPPGARGNQERRRRAFPS